MDLAGFASGFTRLLRDQAVVEGNLPATTRYLEVDGARGWLFPVTSEAGDAFQLFLWFDGSAYQVKLVRPVVDDRLDPHRCHLFPDGRICLSEANGGGMPTLQGAFAKSVVWCNGFSVFRRTGSFPF